MVAEEKEDIRCISAESAERLRHREQSSQAGNQVWRQEFEMEILQTLAVSGMQSPKHLFSETMMAISGGLMEKVIRIIHARDRKDVVDSVHHLIACSSQSFPQSPQVPFPPILGSPSVCCPPSTQELSPQGLLPCLLLLTCCS